MKLRTATKQIEITIYGCDHCDFEDENPRVVQVHIADYHLCLEEKLGHYRFDSKENALNWLQIKIPYHIHEVEWQGPGWYQIETWSIPHPQSEYPEIGIKLVPGIPNTP